MAEGPIKANIDLDVDDVKAWLGISVDTFDDLLELVLSACLDLADDYCNNPFTEDDGSVLIPDGVKFGVLQSINAAWQQCPAALRSGAAAPGTVTSRSADGLSVAYGSAAAGFFGVTDLMGGMGPIMRNALSAYRLMPY